MSEAAVYEVQLVCPPDNIRRLHDLLESIYAKTPSVTVEDRTAFETALVELASNVIVHGGKDSVVHCSIRIESFPDRIEATLTDTGTLVDLDLDGYSMPSPLAESGRGIPLIRTLVNEFTHGVAENLNYWHIVRRFQMATEAIRTTTDFGPDWTDEASRQAALDRLEILDTPPEERFDRITRLAKQLFGVETALISLIDHDRQWFKSKIGFDLTEGKRRDAFCNTTIGKPEVLDVSDATEDPRFRENPLVLGDPKIRFYAGYPIEAAGGERVGALCVFDPKPRILTEAERNLLKDLALWVQKEMTIAQEFDRAAEVQRGLLPKQNVRLQDFEFAGACAPSLSVGGDFYDWYPVSEGEAFTLADVMGKGMAAAIIAATVRAVLRSGSRVDDIARTIETAATILQDDLDESSSFVTLFHARLNKDTGVVRYIDAGHGLSIVLRKDGSSERLSSESQPLGLSLNAAWAEQSFTLNPGDTLISMSDGVLDLFDGTLNSLVEVEKIARDEITAKAMVNRLIGLARKTAIDDVTVVIVRNTAQTA